MERFLKSSRAGRVWFALVLACAAHAWAEPASMSCHRQEVFVAGESTQVVHLSRQLVIAESDSVCVRGGALVRGEQYRTDYAQGIIYLMAAPLPGDTIVVTYTHLPAGIKPSYCLRPVGRNTCVDAEVCRTPGPSIERQHSYDIKASGSKTISVETGTLSDLRVNQSLNLALGGTVGEGVEIRGVLSDRDASFTSAGSTTKLKDLDRIFMEVRSSDAYARVGDLEINESPGELLKLKRNVTGFLGDATYGSQEVVACGAASRSVYETAEIMGREGISGPYVVAGPGGDPADIVKYTEKVWLDGVEMARGSEADYTIDYTVSEIYFNPRHLIRDDARIIVDYESRQNDDRKQIYFARSDLNIGSRTSVAVSFVNEGSSTSEASLLGNGEEGKPVLGSGGEDWVDGGRFVGAGLGKYVKVDLDTLRYYEFVGEGLGDYEVTFTKVEDGAGRYSYIYSDEFDTYIHVFTGQGDYTDMVKARPDVKSQVVHVKAAAKPLPWLELTSEAARSEGNCMHPDDAWSLETDKAYTVDLNATHQLPGPGGVSFGSIDIRAGRRSIGPNYIGFDRMRRPDFLEVWAQEPADGAETSDHVSFAHNLGDKLKTTFEMGSLGTGAGDSRRYLAGVDLGDERLGLSASMQKAHMVSTGISRASETNGLEVRVPVKPVLLSAGRNYELRLRLRDSTSTRRSEYFSGADLAGKRGGVHVRLSTSSEERDEGRGWADYSSVVEGEVEFDTKMGKALAVRGGVSRRDVRYSSESGLGDNRATGADLHLNLRDLSVISAMSLDYRLANTLSALYSTKLVKVDYGDYDSLGNYCPEGGGYALSRYETGKRPVTRVKADFMLELGRKGKVILDRSLSSQTVVDIEGEDAGGGIEKIALLGPGYLTNSRNVVYGLIDIKQEVVMRRSRALTVSMAVAGSRLVDGRCTGRRELKNTIEVSGRISSSEIRGVGVRLEGKSVSTASEWRTETGVTRPSRKAWTALLDLQKNVGTGFEGRLEFELSDEDRTGPDSHTLETRIGPGLTLFAGPLRYDANVGIRRLLSSDTDVIDGIPRRDSVDWNSRVNSRQGRHTSLSVEYSGHKYRGLPTVHNVRASLSAAF